MDSELIQQQIPMVLTALVSFLGFIWVLKHYGVEPVLRILDERREKIAAQFNEIDAAEKRVASLKDEYEEKLREIDEEARRRMLEEVNRGRRIAEEITENAHVEANRVIEAARENVKIQVDKARAQLKEDMVAMTLAATEKLIHERLDDDRHRELVASFIDQLEER